MGLYEVSDCGRVRSLTRTVKGRSGPTRYRSRILKPAWSTGYALVTLAETGMGRREQRYVHDLVLATFRGPKPEGREVCHGPEGQRVNTLANLRYDTRSANSLDRHIFGVGWPKFGRKPPVIKSCAVCETPVEVRRHKNAPFHLCKHPLCRVTWGRWSEARKHQEAEWLFN